MNPPAKTKIMYRLLPAFYLMVFSLYLVSGCSPASGKKYNITFRVLAGNIADSEKIYIAGNDESLGLWNADGIPLIKMPGGSYAKTLQFTEGTHLEFKFTKGTWFSEGADENGNVFKNFSLLVKHDTTLTVKIANWLSGKQETVFIAPDRDHHIPDINLNLWKYQPGDDLKWAEPLLDDSRWETTDPTLLPGKFPKSGFNGTGWFRIHIAVDSSLWDMPFALHMWQAGASEIYLDGKLLYRFGKIGTSEKDQLTYEDRNPQVLSLKDHRNHIIAVRYSNYSFQYNSEMGVESGFGMKFGNLQEGITQRTIRIREITGNQMIFSVIPFAFAVFHFLLFIFYPRFRENLYYALCMLCFAAIIFSSYQISQAVSVREIINNWLAQYPLRFMTVIFGFLTYRALVKAPLTKLVVFYILLGIALSVHGVLWHNKLNDTFFYIYFSVVTIVTIRGLFSSSVKAGKDAYIVGIGYIILSVLILNDMLSYYGYSPFPRLNNPALYGMMGLSASMLVYLSRKFAKTTKDLELQLVQVKELSEKTLAQERLAKQEEIKHRVLEADNLRKTKELEDAKHLQLSMLPKLIPSRKGLDIAVSMTTAVEVGGDYYDFRLEDEGSLLIAIGDATGHGLKAGIMVAAMKSIFSSLKIGSDLPKVFNRCSEILRQMHFDKMYMALTLVRIKENSLAISAAGMPPMLIFRAETGKAETITLKGMPLGAVASFPYCMEEIEFKQGDTLLLMSDGFIELFNEKSEMLELPCAIEMFERCAEKSPQEIVDALCKEADKWRGKAAQADDMTFVAVKKA